MKVNDILNDSEFDSYDAKVDAIVDLARNMELELERLRVELAAEKQANTELQIALGAKDYDLTEVRDELAAAKALLLECLDAWTGEGPPVVLDRIRAALGDSGKVDGDA